MLNYNSNICSQVNFFYVFNDVHYIQISETAMRTKIAPYYANIFTGRLEHNLLLSARFKPLSLLRFIDDIEMKCVENRDCLTNNKTPSIIQSNSQLTYLVQKRIFGHYLKSGRR